MPPEMETLSFISAQLAAEEPAQSSLQAFHLRASSPRTLPWPCRSLSVAPHTAQHNAVVTKYWIVDAQLRVANRRTVHIARKGSNCATLQQRASTVLWNEQIEHAMIPWQKEMMCLSW